MMKIDLPRCLLLTAIPLLLLPEAALARKVGDPVLPPDPPEEPDPAPRPEPAECEAPPPTIAQCQTPSFIERGFDACRSRDREACGKLLEPLWKRDVAALPGTATALVGEESAKRLKTGRAFPALGHAPLKATLGLLTYQTRAQVGRLTFPTSSTANPAPQHPAWEANGAVVESCSEYAYESFYDRARFIEAAETCGDDAGCVYRLAMGTETPGLQKLLLKKNGKPIRWQVSTPAPGTSLPPFRRFKNAFFWNAAFLRSRPAYASDPTFRAKAEAIIAHVAGTPGYAADSEFAWHKTMNASYRPTITEAELMDVRERVAAYQQAAEAYDVAAFALKLLPPYDPTATDDRAKRLNELVLQHQAALEAAAGSLTTMLMAEWDHVSAADGITRDRGCLATDTTKCDWSPRDFSDAYINRRALEIEFARCVEETADDLSQVPAAHKVDSDALSAWFESRHVPKLAAGTIGQRTSDAEVFGNKEYFAASYSYDAGWAVTGDRQPGSNRICKLRGSAHARATASGWVFDRELKVLDTDTYLRVREQANQIQWHSHSRILGQDVYRPVDGAVTMRSASYEDSSDHTLLHRNYSKWFWVGPVLVKVSIGAEVKAGMSVALKATAAEGCNPDNLAYDARASAEPWMKVHGTSSLSIGVYLVQGGIRGEVDVIAARAPVSARANLVGGVNDLRLQLEMDGKFALEALRGQLYVYLETCYLIGCSDLASREIYSERGRKLEVPLVKYWKSITFPVFDAATSGAKAITRSSGTLAGMVTP